MCLFPVRASQYTISEENKYVKFLTSKGEFIKKFKPEKFGTPSPDDHGDLLLPCGKCIECIQSKSIEWAQRVKHELSLHEENCFITLTYNDENLKSSLVVYEDFQNFIRRLKREFKQKKIRYIMSAEYGDNYKRPHFHAIIFGISFTNLKYHSTTKSGSKIYTSKQLEKLWTYGFSSIGEANERTAYYIASYCLKDTEHSITDDSGEIISQKNFLRVSKNPAIGLEYLRKNYKQITDTFFHTGEKIPRYYQKKLSEEKFQNTVGIDNSLYEKIENEKQFKIQNRGSYEKLAKHTISHSKNSLHNTEYRGANDQEKIQFEKRYLEFINKQTEDYK